MTTIATIESLASQGQLSAAEAACRTLLASDSQAHQAWAWLGMLALAQSRPAEAESALRRAIAIFPGEARYWNPLSISLRLLGKLVEAEAAARHTLALQDSGEHWAGLANCLYEQQSWAEASAAYQQALSRNPHEAQCWTNLGAAEQSLGNRELALQAYERALSLSPGDVNAATRYALLEIQLGAVARGVERIRRVVEFAPQLPAAWLVLASGERLLDNLSAAEAAYRQAVSLAPRDRDARYNLVLTLLQQMKLIEAEQIAHQLTSEQPHDAEAWIALGGALHGQARLPEAVAAMQRSVELRNHPTHHSKLLVALHYLENIDPPALLAAHQAWNAKHAQSLAPQDPLSALRQLDSARPLRIGLVASDFSVSPSGYLMLRAVECLDKSRCFVAFYSDRLQEDERTLRFKNAADLWRPTMSLSDEQLARQVRQDEIDVLIDLGGHVGRRLLAFARRPATLQVTWLGYVGTTGLAAMDGLIADRFHVRPGEETRYTEQVLRMPNGYACYDAAASLPLVGPLPALQAGQITFGCFNNPAKYSPSILSAWAAILQQLPTSRLLLKYAGLEQPELRWRLANEFVARGVRPEQLLLEAGGNNREMMSAYQRVDLALDTQPYSGGLTTCEALWMGVPVITFPGQGFASRHATSHLTNAGYPQFVASDLASYVALAVEWTGRIDELTTLRQAMREQVRQSPLCDGPRFASDLLALLSQAYAERVALGTV